jgi:hypothetical protein
MTTGSVAPSQKSPSQRLYVRGYSHLFTMDSSFDIPWHDNGTSLHNRTRYAGAEKGLTKRKGG